jgi:hypothetical protein
MFDLDNLYEDDDYTSINHMNIDVGEIICLVGITSDGKKEIERHGNFWTVNQTSYYKGDPCLTICSQKRTQKLGNQRTKRNRIILVSDDENFRIQTVNWENVQFI